MKKFLIPLFLLFVTATYSQTGTEIYLFDIHVEKDQISISNPKNITDRAGYDNQPNFHRTEPIIYFSSFNGEGRSDIKSYNYKTKETKNLTTTHEREYSPTLTPDGKFISCILQRDDGAQDLVKYPIEGGEPIILINNLLIGYHAWIDNSKILTYVLLEDKGELRYFDLNSNENIAITTNIGRSLHKIPSQHAMSFVDKTIDSKWTINKFDPITKKISVIAKTLPLREDLCWTNEGSILMSNGENIYFLNLKHSNEWELVKISDSYSFMKGITRLAINNANNKLAVVVSE